MEEENKNRDIEALFFRDKPARLLVYIKNESKPYASILAKKIDCTYAHTVKLLQKMQGYGLIGSKKDGRTKYITLTDFGTNLAEDFDNLLNKRMVKSDIGGD